MNNAGNPNQPPSRKVFLLLLIVLTFGLLLALYMGTQVIGVLYGIVAPPEPPLPARVLEISHTTKAYGVDEWAYATEQQACDVVTFYIEQGGQCSLTPPWCSNENQLAPRPGNRSQVAFCNGNREFATFAMRWSVEISAGYIDDGPTRLDLIREISWMDPFPTENP